MHRFHPPQLESEREKVATYTQLEIDLDTAIVQTACVRGNGPIADGDASGTDTYAALDDAMNAVPVLVLTTTLAILLLSPHICLSPHISLATNVFHDLAYLRRPNRDGVYSSPSH
jgi:hypothetical protein